MHLNYTPHERISLRNHPDYAEKWVQEQIAADPSLLGLGELDVKDIERMPPRAGRLDMLLYDADANTRYEVELQLGATDESHIIRTLEYWDIERRRYPQYDHVGVIVAEEITARFFNVISLFNGFIPLVAIQLNAIRVGEAITLVFTTVLDRTTLGLDEEDGGGEPTNRSYWEQKASPATLRVTDLILGLINEIDPAVALKYNKYYIGLAKNGVVNNFVAFRPRRQHVIAEFSIARSDELTDQIEEAGLESLAYQARWGQYRIQLHEGDLDANAELLRDLVRQAYENSGSAF